MRRLVAAVGLVVLPLAGFAAPAEAIGYGVCAITGTISFTAETDTTGTWSIKAAAIDCQGLFAARRRIIGRGPLRGSGTFSTLSPAGGGCFQSSGDGEIEYRIPTTGGELQVNEDVTLTVAGAGTFSTPSLNGPMQLPPPYGGECLTKPVGKSTFVAEVVLLRNLREPPNPDRLPIPIIRG
jgi:hypothetical protein